MIMLTWHDVVEWKLALLHFYFSVVTLGECFCLQLWLRMYRQTQSQCLSSFVILRVQTSYNYVSIFKILNEGEGIR